MKKLASISLSLLLSFSALVVMFQPMPVYAAIAKDTSAVATSGTCSATITIPSYTITGTNTVLVVSTMNANTTVLSVTWGSTNLVKADGIQATVDNEVWYAATGSGGTNTITMTAVASFQRCGMAAISLTGVDQTTPLDAHNSASCSGACSNASVSVTTTKDNDWIVNSIGQLSKAVQMNPGSGLTNFASTTIPSAVPSGFVGSYKGPVTPAGSTAMNYTNTTANWTMAIGAFMPVQGGGGGGSNSCTYSGSGDWNIKYSDNCLASTTVQLASGAKMNIIRDGAGSFGVTGSGIILDPDGAILFVAPVSIQLLSTTNGVTVYR